MRWLSADGAWVVVRGKGNRQAVGTAAQVDLIAIYESWAAFVEVTVPANRARARARLKGHRLPKWVKRMVFVWKPRAREPEIDVVEV